MFYGMLKLKKCLLSCCTWKMNLWRILVLKMLFQEKRDQQQQFFITDGERTKAHFTWIKIFTQVTVRINWLKILCKFCLWRMTSRKKVLPTFRLKKGYAIKNTSHGMAHGDLVTHVQDILNLWNTACLFTVMMKLQAMTILKLQSMTTE